MLLLRVKPWKSFLSWNSLFFVVNHCRNILFIDFLLKIFNQWCALCSYIGPSGIFLKFMFYLCCSALRLFMANMRLTRICISLVSLLFRNFFRSSFDVLGFGKRLLKVSFTIQPYSRLHFISTCFRRWLYFQSS